jgi:hypothetical protein
MKLMSALEVAQLHDVSSADACFRLKSDKPTLEGSAALPLESTSQTILAKEISELLLAQGCCVFEMTYWHNDLESNQDLFYGYRRGYGDERSLSEAAIYQFEVEDHTMLSSILSMTLYFRWDARASDAGKTYILLLSHDGFVDYKAYSEAVIGKFERLLTPYQKVRS